MLEPKAATDEIPALGRFSAWIAGLGPAPVKIDPSLRPHGSF